MSMERNEGKGKPRRGAGVLSIVLLAAAVTVAAVGLYAFHPRWGYIWLWSLVPGFLVVVLLFCPLCADRDRCPHVVFGFLARRLRPRATPGSLPGWVLALTGVTLAPPLLAPLALLWGRWPALAGYVLLLAGSLVLIGCRVCPACGNSNCPFNRGQGQPDRQGNDHFE